MPVETTVALIALAASVLSALFAAVLGALGQARLRRLEASMHEQRRQLEVVERYREPLVRAAYELQSRLWNIASGGFLARYHPAAEGDLGQETQPSRQADELSYREYAVNSTAWLVAQYLCWVELLRREAQFLRLQRHDETVRLQDLLERITHTLSSDSLDPPLRVFRSQQRAIGELMIVEGRDSMGAARSDCRGYASFCERLQDPKFLRWVASL